MFAHNTRIKAEASLNDVLVLRKKWDWIQVQHMNKNAVESSYYVSLGITVEETAYHMWKFDRNL